MALSSGCGADTVGDNNDDSVGDSLSVELMSFFTHLRKDLDYDLGGIVNI